MKSCIYNRNDTMMTELTLMLKQCPNLEAIIRQAQNYIVKGIEKFGYRNDFSCDNVRTHIVTYFTNGCTREDYLGSWVWNSAAQMRYN